MRVSRRSSSADPRAAAATPSRRTPLPAGEALAARKPRRTSIAPARSDRRLESIREAMRAEMAANALMDLEKEEAEKAQALARERARAQMQEMMEERGRTDEERAELEDVFRAQQAEMEERFAATSAAREEHRVLQERLAAMEAKVVKGGTNLLDQEQRLVEEARIREEKMRKMETYAEEQRRRIEDLENLDSIAGESYASVDEEIESKTSKIERLKQAYRRCAADIEDLDDEFVQERDELLEQVRALTRRIKLKNLVLDFCVPPERLAEISERCRWDDGAERWVLEHAAAAGNARARAREEGARASARFGDGGTTRRRRAHTGEKRGTRTSPEGWFTVSRERRRRRRAFDEKKSARAAFAHRAEAGRRHRGRHGRPGARARDGRALACGEDARRVPHLRRGQGAEECTKWQKRKGRAAEDARGDPTLPDGAAPSAGARARPRGALGPGRPGTPGAAGTRAWTRYVRGNLTPRGFRSRGGW